ncbi:amino acid/amide ABC transporter membrane protein 2 (HAAT family) /amino acid/amide ABC transporter ATP-binding protein 1 (HAAT family) [Actinocorallia herbida]|uniref:Amino acid/amide ABC transporter membrane protein 2 (HAAT family) /amino acid/amide ABC transporter ATP-binding protein 1 (HAAT family) n=1 Tax=Actinocorallia herbida TaxID=58109 RepID=A0A3N1D272_9ACTN|nr:branched-chain amino acid ABC transporter ATP-binding protein/permease [Actinocorallia herbida]ROO87178.1 amino acid/amide ABC transporter membrane protein 2 (HAAT family) /amino acid/amide ABC transporter ATP-binding protein 1 (HAAT family) [Actinocorallia herbida]
MTLRGPGKLRLASLAAGAVVLYALPYALGSYAIHVVDVAIIFALLAIGLGLVMGIAGQVNLAQIAFFGVSSYATALLTTQAGYGFWVAGLLAMGAALLAGLLVGLPALRVQSHYLGIVTLGLALAFLNWIVNTPMAGGADGISNIPVPPLFGVDLESEYLYYYLEVVVFALALAFGLFVVRTPLGRRMRAMRDDPLAAGAIGVEIPYLRMTAFVLASFYGGLAGVLYAGLIRYVAPETFSIANMFLLLAMVIVGGRQSLWGCVVGAIGLALIREWLVEFSTYAQLGYGVVVVLMVVFAPTGLAGIPRRLEQMRDRRRAGARAALGDFEPYPAVAEGDVRAPSLEIREISKHFRGVKALNEISFTVAPGAIHGVVGPNGSGKTTLFNVISGLYKATAGQVLVDGQIVSGATSYQLSHLGIARTFQNLRLFGDMTVRENILVALDRTRIRWIWRYALWQPGVWKRDRDLRARADALLTRFGLTDYADTTPGSLPYGIQRRIEIARAMASEPRILLLDEPAAGLNGEEVRQLSEIVRSIRDRGVTVVVIEHNMGFVMTLCARVTVLASGRIIADGTPAEVVATPAVIEAYLGDESMSQEPMTLPTEVQ